MPQPPLCARRAARWHRRAPRLIDVPPHAVILGRGRIRPRIERGASQRTNACEQCAGTSSILAIAADWPVRIRYPAIRPWLVGDRKFAMITKFDSLYAGHTDLDNIGYGGTPINERRYSNAHLATALSKAECKEIGRAAGRGSRE